MSEGVKGVVISHGGLAAALVEAVEAITGSNGALVAVTNAGCGREALEARVREAIGSGPTVAFVDMPAGSCLHAVLASLRAVANVAVVAGVNLPMLLDFVHHHEGTPAEAAARAVAAGGKSIRRFPA